MSLSFLPKEVFETQQKIRFILALRTDKRCRNIPTPMRSRLCPAKRDGRASFGTRGGPRDQELRDRGERVDQRDQHADFERGLCQRRQAFIEKRAARFGK